MRLAALTGFVVLIGLAALLPHTTAAFYEKPSAQSAADDPQERKTRGPLPDYYGKLGLNEPQKVKLYAIQDTYEEKIEALEKQIAQLENARDKDMETLLTPGQTLRLQELRDEARLQAKEADELNAKLPEAQPAE